MASFRLKTVVFNVPECVGRDITDPDQAARCLKPIFDRLDGDREHFVMLALNSKSRLIGHHLVATGTQSACMVHPREVFRPAIALGAAAIVVAHNHPSGDALASQEDINFTRRLCEVGIVVGIPVVDSFVLTSDGIRSVDYLVPRLFGPEPGAATIHLPNSKNGR